MADNFTTAGIVVCFIALVWLALASYTFLNVWIATGDMLSVIGIALVVTGSMMYIKEKR